jgi:GTP cyclohydrolase I
VNIDPQAEWDRIHGFGGSRVTQQELDHEASIAESARFLLTETTGLKDDVHGTDTPLRFVNMLRELTTPPPIKWKAFPAEGDEMVSVYDIPFVSLCNHHVVPFIGKAHIGYVPEGLNAGLSKFARVVKWHAAGLQVQERLTTQVANWLQEHLQPKGLIVVMEAEHLCMTIRGVQSPGTQTRTTAVKGVFADHERTAKAEFLAGLNGRH